jgi:putative serine protease PepD
MSQFAALSQPGAQQQPGVPHQPGVPLQPGLMAQPGVRQQPPDPGQPPAPAGPTSTRAKRRGRTPLLIGVTALVAAVIATAGAAIVLKDNTGGGTVRDGSGTYAELSSGKSGAVAAPVDAGSGSAVDWSKVATAVQPAVVAIQVSAQYSGAEGSGVIVNAKEGYVVTNNHVVSGAEEIQATLSDGRIYKAQTIGTDPSTDLAVIQLTSPPGDLKEARLGDSTKVVVGEPVMAVGNPLGYDNTVTQGIVSALNRPVTTAISGEADTAVTNVIQIDAAINPGNSGGPLFNAKGEVIGLNSSIATLQSSPTETAGSIGVAFAIPVNLVKDISAQLIDQGKAQHAYLGVELGPATVTVDGVTRHGVEILAVRSGTPAASSGLKVNDVITAIDGNPTRESESLMAWVRSYSPGQEITLNVVRGDEALDIELALGVYDDAAAQDPSQQNPSQQDPNQQDPSQQDPNQQDPYSELSPDQLPPGWEEFFGTEDPWGGR